MTESKPGPSEMCVQARFGTFVWIFWVLLILWAPAHATEQKGAAQCDEMDASEIKSPDSLWTAKVYGKVCDLGLSTSASVVVELTRKAHPSISQRVLGITMPTQKSEWPKLQWDSPGKLMIQLPSHAEIGLQMAYYQGVEIQVDFCPDGPAGRARWLEYNAAYRKWVKDTSAWVERKKREPGLTAQKPARPQAPESVSADAKCLL